MQARRTDSDELADLAELLMTVARELRRQTAADPSVLDLNATEVTVLHYLVHHPDATPSAVAAATRLQRSNMSRALRDLGARGLVERSPAPGDSRQTVLRATTLATEDLAKVRALWARVLGDALAASGEHHDVASAIDLMAALERGV